MQRERSRSRDSDTACACDLTPTSDLRGHCRLRCPSRSRIFRLYLRETTFSYEKIVPESVLDRDARVRQDREVSYAERPFPVVRLPHEEPRLRALQSAGLEFEDGDPGIRTPPLHPPVRDDIVMPASAIVFSSAWPESPPPAQPTRTERSIICDNRPVSSAFAAAYALVWELMNDVERIIRPWSPPCVTLRGTRCYWRDVRLVHFPRPRPVICLHPYGARRGHWERFTDPRLIPIIAHGHVTRTMIVAQHIHIEEIQRRISLETRINRYWQFLAIAPDTWVIIAHYLTTQIVDQLEELEELGERVQRGGHKNSHASHLEVHDQRALFGDLSVKNFVLVCDFVLCEPYDCEIGEASEFDWVIVEVHDHEKVECVNVYLPMKNCGYKPQERGGHPISSI